MFRTARDYWGRMEGAPQPGIIQAPQPGIAPARTDEQKPSLLRRLAGVGRPRRETEESGYPAEPAAAQPLDEQPEDPPAELPVFFGHNKRR